ncbi:MAG: hydrogenase maturation protease [Deferrisomatales bacterium]
MKTLVLALGNPILTDDGVGLAVARELEGRLAGADVTTATMVGLDLLELVRGYDRVFLVDALTTRGGRPGEVHELTPEDGTLHLFSSHGVNFFDLLELGRRLGEPVPEVAGVYGIEIGEEVAFGHALSPEVEAGVARAVERICREVGREGGKAAAPVLS